MKYKSFQNNGDFKCLHCHNFVSAASFLSGVNNRNHCPYCLSSRHLDLHAAGDRLSACKARMEPVGLTLKKTNKKYAQAQQGELMLIHRCTDCGKMSINRIAADDDAETVLAIYHNSLSLDRQTRSRLEHYGVDPLLGTDKEIVYARLYGKGILPQGFKSTEWLQTGIAD